MCFVYITPLVFILLVAVPAISANAIGCKMACKKCRDKVEHPSIVTVYCEMCDECKAKRDQRLKEQMALRTDASPQVSPAIIEVDNLADCPPPPPCEPEIIKLTKRTTTTTTTTTEAPRRCPPAPKCVLKKTTPCPTPPPPPPPPLPLYPCMQGIMPMCNYMQPMYGYPPQLPQPPMPAVQRQQTAAPSQAPASLAPPTIQEVTPSIVKLTGELIDPLSYDEVLVFQGAPAMPTYNYYMQPVYEMQPVYDMQPVYGMQPVYAYPPQPPIPVVQCQAEPSSLAPATTTEVTPAIIKLKAEDQTTAAPSSQQPNQDETPEYQSVYVGIPKDLLPNMDEEYDENLFESALLL